MHLALVLSVLLASSLATPAQTNGAIGSCLAGMCPPGYTCSTADQCVPRRTKRGAQCTKANILGECLAGICPEGYACDGIHCC